MISGTSIKIAIKTLEGTDPFGKEVYSTIWDDVDDVLVGYPSTQQAAETLEIYGKRAAYTLGIPKGDAHRWEDTEVILPPPFEGKYRTIGFSVAGIPENVPLRWNRQIQIERYE